MKTILVPVDYSLRSREAVRWAKLLAAKQGAQVVLLHVLPAPGKMQLYVDAYLGLRMPHPSVERTHEAEARLNEFASSLGNDGVTVRCLVEHGIPEATIVRIAAELPADLVVMGTHARTGMVEWALGSIAHKVQTCAPCPVITLRGDEPPAHP
jgi:nucleotide-binding universal stress UspA family protein